MSGTEQDNSNPGIAGAFAASQEALKDVQNGEAAQVEPTRDQKIKRLFLDLKTALESLGAKALVVAAAFPEGDNLKPVISMSGPLAVLHNLNLSLAGHSGGKLAEVLAQHGQKVIVPEGEARRQAAAAGQGPAIIVPGAR